MSLVEQQLLTLPEQLSSPPVFSGVRVTRSLVLYVCFVDRCLSFCTFSFGHCVVCSSSMYGFRLPLWYLQTLLNIITLLFPSQNIHTHTTKAEVFSLITLKYLYKQQSLWLRFSRSYKHVILSFNHDASSDN